MRPLSHSVRHSVSQAATLENLTELVRHGVRWKRESEWRRDYLLLLEAFRQFRSHSLSYTRSPQKEYETCVELWELQSPPAPCRTLWRATGRSGLTWWCSCAAWVSSCSPFPALRRLFTVSLASDFLLSLCGKSLGKGERSCLSVITSEKSVMHFSFQGGEIRYLL